MLVDDARREVRSVFLRGFAGQLVPGTIWLLSAALGTWGLPLVGVAALHRMHWFHPAFVILTGAILLVSAFAGRSVALAGERPPGGVTR